jgi:lysozyme
MSEPMSRGKKLGIAAALATAIAGPAEGLRQIAYYDPPGILTVCAGHTGPDVVKGKRYSLEECDALLTADMKKAVAQVNACHPGLPVEVLAAFSDAAFNMGPAIACDARNSTAARMLYAGQLAAACNQLPRWNKARFAGQLFELPGLTKRREQERVLCLRGAT